MSGERKRKPSSGTAGGGWERWWPRVTAAGQFLIGAATFVHEVVAISSDRPALQFWAVTLMFGAPSASVALRIIAERIRRGIGPRAGGGS
jgi:hypothetical protein